MQIKATTRRTASRNRRKKHEVRKRERAHTHKAKEEQEEIAGAEGEKEAEESEVVSAGNAKSSSSRRRGRRSSNAAAICARIRCSPLLLTSLPRSSLSLSLLCVGSAALPPAALVYGRRLVGDSRQPMKAETCASREVGRRRKRKKSSKGNKRVGEGRGSSARMAIT